MYSSDAGSNASNSMNSDRKERERLFQRKQSQIDEAISPTPIDVLERYRENRHWRLYPKECMYRAMGNLDGKRVLDFGCGSGEISTQLALLGADVLAFDLSPDHLELARRRASLDGVLDRVNFLVADGENANLPNGAFDFVVAYAVLHHMKLQPALQLIHQALKPDGRVFIVEPVSFSHTLAWLRDRVPVPKNVSPDERQLNEQEISFIVESFEQSSIRYYRVLERLERLLPHVFKHGIRQRVATGLSRLLRILDRGLLLIPGTWRLAGRLLVTGTRKPETHPTQT